MDTSVCNSSGYFADPVTKQPFTGSEPRVIKCELLPSGKLVWPQIKASNGESVKLVFKLWTPEEKEIYKAYRTKGKIKQLEREVLPKEPQEEYTVKPVPDDYKEENIGYNYWSAPSKQTEEIITKCDMYAGTWNCNGLMYAIIAVKGVNTFYHIPRDIISGADMQRICNGNSRR